MAMSSVWSEGYVTDTLYTDNIYREQSPAWINHVAALNGCVPRPLDAPFSYLELGCALGHSLTIFAAAFPHGAFVGVDFNPAHIDHAQRRARALGLTNVTFIEASFQDLAAGPRGTGSARGLGQFDFVALHGIYSWITAEARGAVQRLLFDRLKPGGLVYNSYNALPGWSAEAPLQRLISEFARDAEGDSAARAQAALGHINGLAALKSGYFAAQPGAARAVANMARRSGNYLAHEFLNGTWNAFYSADIADEMAQAKLDFAGSATLLDNYPDHLLPAPALAFLKQETDPRRRQLLQDFLANQKFRRDIFVRGHARLGTAERQQQVDAQHLVANKPFGKLPAVVAVPAGPITLEAEGLAFLQERLAQGTVSRADCAAELTKAGKRGRPLDKMLTALTAGGTLVPAARAHMVQVGGSPQRLASEVNRRILAAALAANGSASLASPVSGAAIKLSTTDSLMLHLVLTGCEDLEDGLAKQMAMRNLNPARNGRAITPPDERAAYFKERVGDFFGGTLPILQRLAIVEADPDQRPGFNVHSDGN